MSRLGELADKLERGEIQLSEINAEKELAVLGLRHLDQVRTDTERYRQYVAEQAILSRSNPQVAYLTKMLQKYPALIPLVGVTVNDYLASLLPPDEAPDGSDETVNQ